MSRDVLTVGSTMRIPLLYRGEYSQWVEKFMNYLEEQTDGEAIINSIKNGDQPLPPLKDKSMWYDQEKRVQNIDCLARSLLIQGLPNDIYSLIDSNKTAKDLWDALARHMLGLEYGEQDKKAAVLYECETFKATEGELLLDTYNRYLQVINYLKKCGYSKDNCELNFKFLNNLQPEWKQYATMIRHNKNLMNINIDALYNILKQNQGDVNDAIGSKKKIVVVTFEPLALIAEKTNVSRSKEKVVVSSDSKGSEADDFSELKKITTLLAKAFNRRKSANKKQEFVETDDKKVGKKADGKKRDMSREKYGKLEAERYEYMIRYSANFDNDKQHRKQIGSKKKTVVVTSDPLALIAEKTNVSKSKEKVFVSLDSEGSEADDLSEMKKIIALLAKAFNRRKFYSKPTNNSLRTSSSSQSANKKQEFLKTDNKRVEKKDDEKKRDMSKVKCYNCKKEGHFAKDCKKAKEINANMVFMAQIEKVLSDSEASSSSADEKISEIKKEQVLLAEDQAWMELSSDSDQEIFANMVFMAQIEKVLSYSEASSSSADEKISKVSYYLSESKSESEFETSGYYNNSTYYGLFVNNDDDDQEIFHDVIKSASENFIENHIDSQKDYDKSDVDHNDSEEKII
nr:hypothetical protein [Tanacetum cinerariifolium]